MKNAKEQKKECIDSEGYSKRKELERLEKLLSNNPQDTHISKQKNSIRK